MSETKTKEKKGFILRALDTVERVGNGLPNPSTIFIILTAAVIVISAICAACGVSVTYDFLDSKTGEINQMSVAVVSLLAPDSIRHMVTTVVSNFTGFFALGTVFTIMIGVGVADGTGFLSALLRKVAASTPKGLVTSVVVSCQTSHLPPVTLYWFRSVRFCLWHLAVIRLQVSLLHSPVYLVDGVQTF